MHAVVLSQKQTDFTVWNVPLSVHLGPELTCLSQRDGARVAVSSPSLPERRRSVAGGPATPNTGLAQRPWLCSACPTTLSVGSVQVADSSVRPSRRPGLLGNTGLTGQQDVDFTEEVKPSWEQNMEPEVQSRSPGLQALWDVLSLFLPNTGLLTYSGLRSVSPSSPWSASEETEVSDKARSLERLGLLGNVGLLARADWHFWVELRLSWEQDTNPEVLQVSKTLLLSRATWTVALHSVEGKTVDLGGWQVSIWVESELWLIVGRRETNVSSYVLVLTW